MAHPPMPHPDPAQPVDQAKLDAAFADRIEQHVDSWLGGQRLSGRLKSGETVEVSIGERGSIRDEVLTLLCERYTKAGWSKATTAQDVEMTADTGMGMDGKRMFAKLSLPDPRGIVLTLVP